jgi:hypothetical protein
MILLDTKAAIWMAGYRLSIRPVQGHEEKAVVGMDMQRGSVPLKPESTEFTRCECDLIVPAP